MDQAKQPERDLTEGEGCLMDQEEVKRKGELCNSLGEEDLWDSRSKTHRLPNVVLSDLLLTAFTLKENSEYKQRKLVFLWQPGASGLSLRNCNCTSPV